MANRTTRKKGSPKKNPVKAARGSVVTKKGTPWGTIIAVVAVVALAGSVLTYYLVASAPKRDQAAREEAAAEQFAPSEQDTDPSKRIPGVVTGQYAGSAHVLGSERVAYDKTPAFGGPHDQTWAGCNGIVYPQAVRTERMVHGLEHGAVWIAYNPDQVKGEDLDLLKVRVEGKPYTVMSPFPGLDKPISLQSWGHQLKVDSASDERIDQFIAALRTNRFGVYPELGASCDASVNAPDQEPPFDPAPPGPDAKPMDYKGTQGTTQDQGGMPPGQQVPPSPSAPPASN